MQPSRTLSLLSLDERLGQPAVAALQRCLLWLVIVLLGSCGPSSPPPSQPAAPVPRPQQPSPPPKAARLRLTILSTNDLHGQLDPLRRYTDEPVARSYRIGGAEALAATIAELRSADPQGTLLLDAGDLLQGSLLANRYEGAPIRDLFGLLGYDAVAIGNHELDYGPVGVPDPPLDSGVDPRGAFRAFSATAAFPVLSANLRASDGSRLPWPNVRGSVLIRRRGVKVGVIGLTTPETAITTMPAYAEGLDFQPYLPVVRSEARALRAGGAEVIVLLAHGAAECPGPDERSCRGELFTELLAKLEPGVVDAVVAGHSHQPIAHRHRGIPVVEACSRGQVVGRMELWLDGRTHRVLQESRALPPVHVCHDVFAGSGDCVDNGPSPGVIEESPLLRKHRGLVERVTRALSPYRAGIVDDARRVLARAARPLLHHGAGISQTGAFFARALLGSVPGADVALFNGGSIRADLPEGPIRYADLYEAFPFDNRVATVRLSGEQLTLVLGQLLTRHGLPLVAGLQLSIRCGPPRALISVRDGRGRPLQPRRLYTLVLSDFLLTGGDGLGPVFDPIPTARKQIHRDKLIRELIARHLERQRAPLNTETDPIISTRWPPLVFVGGPCPPRSRPHRAFCR